MNHQKVKMPKLKKSQRWLPLVPNLDFHYEQGYFLNEKPISYRMTEIIGKNSDYFNSAPKAQNGAERRIV